MNSRHYPPIDKRYNEKRPTISIRVDKNLKKALDNFKQGENLTYPEVIREILEGADFSEYEERISISCPACQEPIIFSPETTPDAWDEIKRILRQNTDWIHVKCPTGKKKR